MRGGCSGLGGCAPGSQSSAQGAGCLEAVTWGWDTHRPSAFPLRGTGERGCGPLPCAWRSALTHGALNLASCLAPGVPVPSDWWRLDFLLLHSQGSEGLGQAAFRDVARREGLTQEEPAVLGK